jgi:hypothetical protein
MAVDNTLYRETASGILVSTGHTIYEFSRKNDGVISISFGLGNDHFVTYREQRWHCPECKHQHLDPGLFFFGYGSPNPDKQRFDGI